MEGAGTDWGTLITSLSKGLTMFFIVLGLSGVAEGLKEGIVGAAEACEIRPEMASSLFSMSMTSAPIVMVLICGFFASRIEPKDLKSAGVSIGAGLMLCSSVYFGAKAQGVISKHGLPAQSKQKKFQSIFYFTMMAAEIIPLFGAILAIMSFNSI